MTQTIQAEVHPSILTAIRLSWFTIGYNLIEGAVSIGFGISEGSIALAGFGVDSLIEVTSAFLVLWRFRGESGLGERMELERERRATLGVGLLFLFLAVLTAFGGAAQVWEQAHPETTLPGLIVSAVSLSFMFYLWRAKRRVAISLDSSTVMADANCSRACIQLSVVLFAGSLLFLLIPSLWWADAVAALGLSILIAREGVETVRAARKEEFEGGCGCSH